MPANRIAERVDGKAVHGLRFGEFVAMIAGLMAVNAIGIDMMLPALPRIGHDLAVANPNHLQWVILVYLAAFGVAQLAYGPLADRFGRRPILLGAISLYAVMSFVAASARSFEMLLVARALQGMASASSRVLTISIVRDCYVGRRMARVMSLAFTVFLAVPILAPIIGQLVLLVAPWHWIFYILGGFGALIVTWTGLRLPETLDPAQRRPISPRAVGQASWTVITNRSSIGYTLASTCMQAGLIGFLSSIEQIISDAFHAPQFFALCFGVSAGALAVASLLNARIVERFGTRKVSHLALIAMIIVATIRVAIVSTGHETLVLFVAMQALTMFCFGFTGPNFGAMAMDEMGHIAGTASAFQGFVGTIVGSIAGFFMGAAFVDSSLPLTLGIWIGSIVALIVILVTERGKLMRAHHARPAEPIH